MAWAEARPRTLDAARRDTGGADFFVPADWAVASRWRSPSARSTLPLATAAAVVAGTGSPAGAARTNPALTCSAGTIYNLMSNGNFYALNTTSGANTPAAPTTLGPSTSDDNALGISSNGQTAYSMTQSVTRSTVTLAVTTISTDAVADFTVPAGSITNNVAGGVDPVNNEFYYGGWNSADTIFYAYVFNGTTGTEVGSITPGGTQGSGDLAFDGLGDLYVLVGQRHDRTDRRGARVGAPRFGHRAR